MKREKALFIFKCIAGEETSIIAAHSKALPEPQRWRKGSDQSAKEGHALREQDSDQRPGARPQAATQTNNADQRISSLLGACEVPAIPQHSQPTELRGSSAIRAASGTAAHVAAHPSSAIESKDCGYTSPGCGHSRPSHPTSPPPPCADRHSRLRLHGHRLLPLLQSQVVRASRSSGGRRIRRRQLL